MATKSSYFQRLSADSTKPALRLLAGKWRPDSFMCHEFHPFNVSRSMERTAASDRGGLDRSEVLMKDFDRLPGSSPAKAVPP